jgi:hypothetical protein
VGSCDRIDGRVLARLSIENCLAALRATNWFVVEHFFVQKAVPIWLVYGRRRDQQILVRASSQIDAWRAVLVQLTMCRGQNERSTGVDEQALWRVSSYRGSRP